MKETVAKLRSAHLKNERTVWIRKPEPHSEARRLVVFLDAELYREHIAALSVIRKLEADGTISDAWFAFVSMESMEARWKECPCYLPFAKFVAEELIPWLQRSLPKRAAIEERILVGVSYTGLAAAYVAKECPGVFQKVISQSGSFWSNDNWLTKKIRTLKSPIPTAFYLDVGTKETQENVQHRKGVLQKVSQIEGVQRFRDALVKSGHSVKYVEFDGGHESTAWKKTLGGALKWALPKPVGTANAGICHAACDRMSDRMPTTKSKSEGLHAARQLPSWLL